MSGAPGRLSIAPFLARPARTLLVVALLTAGLLWQAAGVETDNTPSAWLPMKDPARDTYQAFRETFGADTFVLVATETVDLEDPALREQLFDLQGRLARLPGVVQAHGPLRRGSAVAHAREALPSQLAHLTRALSFAPNDRDLLLLQARANAGLTFLLAEDPGDETSLARLRLAQDSALGALALDAPAWAQALREGQALATTSPPPDVSPQRLVGPLYWWAFARGAELRASGGGIDLERVDAVMRWVLEHDPAAYDAGPHLYFAMREASVGRSLGGSPQEAAPHFAAARELTGGHALLPSVLEARYLAPLLAATKPGASAEAIRSAQRAAWERFSELLNGVLAAPASPAGAAPELALANAVAQEQARALLADPEDAGLIPPDEPAADGSAQGEDTGEWGTRGDWGTDAEPSGEAAPAGDAPIRLDDGLLARFLIGPARDRCAFLVFPGPDLLPPARAALVTAVQAELAKERGVVFHLAGPEMVTHDLDEASLQSFASLFPLVLLVMCCVLGFTLRSLKVVLAILATAGLTAGWTVGLVALSGRSLNLILVVIPAILAVLTTAYSLHLVSYYLFPAHDVEGRSRGDMWLLAAGHTLRPTLMTSVTTAVGFLSLCTSEIPPVRDLGLFAGAGALIACGLVFTFLPVLLSLTSVGPRRRDLSQGPFTAAHAERAAAGLRRMAWPILGGAALLAGLAAWGLPQLRFESDVLEFFAPDHPLPRAFAEIESKLVGMTPLELWVEGPLERVTAPETVAALSTFLAAAKERPLVTRVVSPFEVEAGLGPRAAGALVRARLTSPEPLSGAEASYLHPTGSTLALRATVACRTTSSEEFHDLVEGLRGALPAPEGVSVRLTGAVPLLVRVQVLLVDTQLRSFGMALVVVTLVLAIVYRSATLVFVSLLPNVLPILLTLGGMGHFGIPLNTATVTVSGIALGLVVHDTIHFLHHHHAARMAGQPRQVAVAGTLGVVGRPIVTTTVAVSLGFGAFAFSPFAPTFYFGVLIALTTTSALACDLLALPALLLVRED